MYDHEVPGPLGCHNLKHKRDLTTTGSRFLKFRSGCPFHSPLDSPLLIQVYS